LPHPSVFGRPLYAVDNKHVDCALARFQFQSELFLYRSKKRRQIRCPGAFCRFRCPPQCDVIKTLKTRLVDEWTVQLPSEEVDEVPERLRRDFDEASAKLGFADPCRGLIRR